MGRSISRFLMVGILLIAVTGVGWANTAGDLTRAEELMGAGQYDAAIGLLSSINTSDSALASRVGTLLATYYLSTKNSIAALAKNQELIKDYPNATQAVEWYRRTAECYANMKKFTECDAALSKAIELVKDPALRMTYRGDRAFILMAGSRKSGLALTEYQAMLRDYPDAPAVQVADWYRKMGECYVSMNKLTEGDAALSQAIELVKNPAVRMMYRGDRAFLLLIGEDYVRALAEYQALENEHWDGPEQAKLMLGICYQRNGDNERALSILQDLQANSKDPEMVKNAMLNSCDCLCQPGKVDEALAMLDMSYEEHADWRPDILLEKGQILADYRRDYASALDTFKKLIADFADWPRLHEVQRRMGLTLIDLGQVTEAKAHFSKLASADPNDAEWAFYLAYCSNREGNWAAARDALVTASNSFPIGEWFAQAEYFYGDCCISLGDKATAIAAFEDVASAFAGNTWAKEANMRLNQLQSPNAESGTVPGKVKSNLAFGKDKIRVAAVVNASKKGAESPSKPMTVAVQGQPKQEVN